MNAKWKAISGLFLATVSICPLRAAHPLEEWGQRTAPGTGYILNAIAFGNGVFVTVGGNSVTLVSSDGANWTNTSPGNYGELRNVQFLNGEFNVVGNMNQLLRSADGVSWTAFTLPAGNYWDVAYGNNVYVVIGSGTFASSDRVSWIDTAPRTNLFGGQLRVVRFDCLTFGAGKFVAMPRDALYSQEQGVFHSTNGTNWTLSSGPYKGPFPSSPSEMAYLNGLFLIADTGTGNFYSSSDGVSWAGGAFGDTQSPPGGVAYGASYFVAPRKAGILPTAFYSSTNGIVWQKRFPQPGFAAPALDPNGIAFANGTFVVVGGQAGSPVIYQSGDLSGKPTILTEPLDRAAVVNNPASFSVVAGGSGPLYYQWQKNGSSISGATNSSFTISSVVAADTGGYHVIVTNSFGSVTSRVAQLSVSFLQIHEYAGITILGVSGKTYRIEASPQAGGTWTVLTNLVLPQSPYVWIDYESPNVGTRIYRAAELP